MALNRAVLVLLAALLWSGWVLAEEDEVYDSIQDRFSEMEQNAKSRQKQRRLEELEAERELKGEWEADRRQRKRELFGGPYVGEDRQELYHEYIEREQRDQEIQQLRENLDELEDRQEIEALEAQRDLEQRYQQLQEELRTAGQAGDPDREEELEQELLELESEEGYSDLKKRFRKLGYQRKP